MTSQYYFRVIFFDPTLNPSPNREGLTPLLFLGKGAGGWGLGDGVVASL